MENQHPKQWDETEGAGDGEYPKKIWEFGLEKAWSRMTGDRKERSDGENWIYLLVGMS